jgi:hypothetical protein
MMTLTKETAMMKHPTEPHLDTMGQALAAMVDISPTTRAAIVKPYAKALQDYVDGTRDVPEANVVIALLVVSSLAFTSPDLPVTS